MLYARLGSEFIQLTTEFRISGDLRGLIFGKCSLHNKLKETRENKRTSYISYNKLFPSLIETNMSTRKPAREAHINARFPTKSKTT